jgi:FkbM family methyltransferase
MRKLKSIVIQLLELLDFQISRISRMPAHHLLQNEIDLVFDVGANSGQYATELRKSGYKGTMVSFEPLVDAHKKLVENAKSDASWFVHSRCAVGDSIKDVSLNVSGNSYSSSILNMLPEHSCAAPDSVYVGKNEVKQITLDSIFRQYASAKNKIFLKIDVQGYEMSVLKGIEKNFKFLTGVQLECSTTPLYEGENTFEKFVTFFKKAGFECWLCLPGFTNPKTGRMLQFDLIYYKKL